MQSAPRLEPFGATAPRSPPLAAVTARQRLWADRAAGVIVRGGGILVIVSLVAILVFLVAETAPLFRGASVSPGRALAAGDGAIAALLVEPRLSHVAAATPTDTSACIRSAAARSSSTPRSRAARRAPWATCRASRGSSRWAATA
jgi:ABC-type uncharacterized transport system permease subunit